jgi:formamidase
MRSKLEVRVDRTKRLAQDPGSGHNRWHPDIPPLVTYDPGEEVILETRDAFDGQFPRHVSLEVVLSANLDLLHPITGPVYINGTEPGDLLDVEIVDIEPDSYGYTAQVPGFGYLRDVFPEPFKIDWDIADGWATSRDLPGVRIPGAPFMGTIGLAPGHQALATITAREQALLDRGGYVLPPNASGAVPSDPGIAPYALRTVPPRETGGNIDIKQLSKGAHLLLPVDTPGGLFSAGDAHYAQGDCETCGTAIELKCTLHVRFSIRKGEAARKGIRWPRFYREDYYLPPEFAAPRRFYATTGTSVSRDGVDHSEDVSIATRNALLNMIDHLTERGWTPQQGYSICSVAVDLKISQLVDVPNMLVSAFLPEDIFVS